MKNIHGFLYGFFCCFSMFVVLLTVHNSTAGKIQRVHSEYDKPGNIKDELENAFNGFQSKEFSVETATPTAANLEEGNVLFVNSTRKTGIVKIGAKRYYWDLTELP